MLSGLRCVTVQDEGRRWFIFISVLLSKKENTWYQAGLDPHLKAVRNDALFRETCLSFTCHHRSFISVVWWPRPSEQKQNVFVRNAAKCWTVMNKWVNNDVGVSRFCWQQQNMSVLPEIVLIMKRTITYWNIIKLRQRDGWKIIDLWMTAPSWFKGCFIATPQLKSGHT